MRRFEVRGDVMAEGDEVDDDYDGLCPSCRRDGYAGMRGSPASRTDRVPDRRPDDIGVPARPHSCPLCGVRVEGSRNYQVEGANADDVVKVVRELERQRLANRGPWRAGLFYLLCLAVVTTVFLVASNLAPIWALPMVLAAAIIGVVVLGALQQRQDGRLTERGFVSVVGAALRNAGSLGRGTDSAGRP
jgi:hypothetical protein